ncbi:hypothetical protein MBLNU13_g00961t1 [Cladosporium sp. NU13]
MSSIHSTSSQRSENHFNQPTLLGMPPEIRNVIYDYAFSADTTRSLAPHALTRTNRLLRQESLSIQWKYVETLVIPLHTRKQLDHFKEWAAAEIEQPKYTRAHESTGKSIAAYPGLQFDYTTAAEGKRARLSFARQELTPTEEYSRMLRTYGLTDTELSQGRSKHVMEILSLTAKCLGTALEKSERFPRDFDYNAVIKDPAPWVVRKIGYRNCPPTRRSWSERLYIVRFFRPHALKKRGAERDATFIRDEVVKYIESVAMFPEFKHLVTAPSCVRDRCCKCGDLLGPTERAQVYAEPAAE